MIVYSLEGVAYPAILIQPPSSFVGEQEFAQTYVPKGAQYAIIDTAYAQQFISHWDAVRVNYTTGVLSIDDSVVQQLDNAVVNAGIKEQLLDIDQKKIRALGDFVAGGTRTRFDELEAHAVILRSQLRR